MIYIFLLTLGFIFEMLIIIFLEFVRIFLLEF